MSWEMVKLGDVCEINMGKTPSRSNPKYWGGNNPWVSIADLKRDYFISKTKENITDLGVKESGIKIVLKNTLLYSFKLSIGKIAITANDLYTNEAIVALPIKDTERLNLHYLYYATQKINLSNVGDKAVKGITLNKEKLKSLQIPLPPLSTQKRIAEILDKADALRKADRQLLKHYDNLAQSLFIDLFGDPVKNEKGWEIGTIRDLSLEVKYGTSSPAEENGTIPYLRMNNITYSGEWDFSSMKYINLDEKDKEKYCLKKNDLIFNRTNSKELVGKTAVYLSNDIMAIAGYLIRVRVNELANPFFVSAFLNSKYGKAVLKNMCKNIVGMANINAQELQNILIPIPPIALQNRFAEQIQNIEQQKEKVKAQLLASEHLFQALLKQAFSGGLN